MNLSFDIEDSSISNTTYIEEKSLDIEDSSISGASISNYRPSISKFLHFCVLQYRSIPTSISKYKPSISKLHIVPDIEAKTLAFNIEGLVFNIVHLSILGIFASISKLGKVPDDEPDHARLG
jgi:hypothetical protein